MATALVICQTVAKYILIKTAVVPQKFKNIGTETENKS